MNGRRLGLALRAAVATMLLAATFELVILHLYDLRRPHLEFVALAIWTPLLGGFSFFWALSLVGVLERGLRFSVLMALGASGGLGWLIVASVQVGMWLAWLDTPVVFIWPLSAGIGFACAAPRPGQGVEPNARARAAALYGLVGVVAFTWEVKLELPRQMGPDFRERALGAVDVRRPTGKPAGTPAVLPALGDAGAPYEPPCHDPAPPPLPLDPLVLDPSAPAEPLGLFTDVRRTKVRGVPHAYGRTLRLWSIGGSLTGILTSRAGPARERGHGGVLERARLDPRSGELTFDAFFEDGFFARFTGVLRDDAVEGVLTTADSECVRRVLSTDSVVLGRQGSLPPAKGMPFRTLILVHRGFRRWRPATNRLMDARVLRVATEHWWGAGTTGLAFSGRFSGRSAAVAALDPDRTLTADGDTLPVRRILHAAEVGRDGYAGWIIVAPSGIAVAYREWIYREAASGEPVGLTDGIVPVLPCCSR